jgi:hypothetical protein
MDSVKLFNFFLAQSWGEFKADFPRYRGSYMAFLAIGFMSSFPWTGLGFGENSAYEITTSIAAGILALVVIVNVILVEKAKIKYAVKEELLYAAPTYLVYTLYSTLLILIGLFCFIIPGIILGVLLFLAPIASVLSEEEGVGYLTKSYKMAMKDKWLVTTLGAVTLLIEVPTFLFDWIPNWHIQLGVNLLYSFVDAAVLSIVTLTSVKVFYHLNKP